METTVTIETWNEQVGEWHNVNEAKDYDAAVAKVSKLVSHDYSINRYRIVTTTTVEL